ncbi:MAG: alpha/beta fold hydrolase [Alicyclobacillaceae bacterium]|nr:alpha/beta fold hydrolase [Alicyclobacillaceae bacterium]
MPAEGKGSPERRVEPFVFEGGPVGILLIHGFTGSPLEMRPMGEWLAHRGYTVCGPALAGHGTTPEDMERTGWRDWLDSAREAYGALRSRCRKVVAAGLSMGGALALHLGADEPGGAPDAVIAMCAPIYLWDWRARLAPIVSSVYRFHREAGGTRYPDEVRQYLGGYEATPTRCVGDLLYLVRRVKQRLPRIRVPALVLQARRDRTVRPESASYIFTRLGSEDKELRWYENSDHILTVDRDRNRVWQDVYDWLSARGLAPEN